MSKDSTSLKGFRIIQGGNHYAIRCGPYTVVAAPFEYSPFEVEATVMEEDTFLVTSAPPVVREVKAPLMKIATRLIETRPEKPGSVLVKGRNPYRFLAIIYDFNEDTICREAWVQECLFRVFGEIRSRGLRSIALPLLGTRYGLVGITRFTEMLKEGLRNNPLTPLERLWLITSRKTGMEELKIMGNSLGR